MNANVGSSSTDEWDRHWRAYADSNAQNPAQAYRRALIFRALDLPRAAPAQVLELGCGQGEFSAELAHGYPQARVLGLDLSPVSVGVAQARVARGRFLQQDLSQPLALPEEYRRWASHAVCSEVLEHLDDPLSALRNARAALAPGARLVITVPAGPMSAFDRHIGHRRHFTPERLRALLLAAGFQVEAVHGAGFPFFNLYRLTVVARGKRLIEDASGALPGSARAAIWAFSKLFRLNRSQSRRGWQLVAVAVEPR